MIPESEKPVTRRSETLTPTTAGPLALPLLSSAPAIQIPSVEPGPSHMLLGFGGGMTTVAGPDPRIVNGMVTATLSRKLPGRSLRVSPGFALVRALVIVPVPGQTVQVLCPVACAGKARTTVDARAATPATATERNGCLMAPPNL